MTQSPSGTSHQLSVDVIRPDELTVPLEIQWQKLRECHDGFRSPYFDVEFTRAVSRVRNDVEIALLSEPSGKLIGILPYQRIARNVAEPVGGRLNDLHGIIGQPCDGDVYSKVLKCCRLKRFDFHALLKTDTGMEEFEFESPDSFYIDLGRGFDAFWKEACQRSSTLKRHGQKSRALQRDVHDLHFEFDCTSESMLESLIQRKRERYRNTKTFDILSVGWASNLLRELHTISNRGFQGILSVLRSGDQFIAGHFGMICNDILHYWFPVYDTSFQKYSPGTELTFHVAREADRIGINKIDFGYGIAPYKSKICGGVETVSCGQIRFNRMSFELARCRHMMRNQLKRIPMKDRVKTVLRQVYPGFGGWNFK